MGSLKFVPTNPTEARKMCSTTLDCHGNPELEGFETERDAYEQKD